MAPDLNSLPPSTNGTTSNGQGSPVRNRSIASNTDNSPLRGSTPSPSPRSPSISLQATAAVNAGLQHEGSRRSSTSSVSRSRQSNAGRRRSTVLMNLQLNDPTLPPPGEMVSSGTQYSGPRSASPSPMGSSSYLGSVDPHHYRNPSLGEIHQELEQEQEAQVNRLLQMIRTQQLQLQQLQTQGAGGGNDSSGAVIDDSTPTSEHSFSFPNVFSSSSSSNPSGGVGVGVGAHSVPISASAPAPTPASASAHATMPPQQQQYQQPSHFSSSTFAGAAAGGIPGPTPTPTSISTAPTPRSPSAVGHHQHFHHNHQQQYHHHHHHHHPRSSVDLVRQPDLLARSQSRASSSRPESPRQSPRQTSTAMGFDVEGYPFMTGGGGAAGGAASGGGGVGFNGRDESAFYQAEAQMMVRENQMLRLRIRELERQVSDLNANSSITREPATPSRLLSSQSVGAADEDEMPVSDASAAAAAPAAAAAAAAAGGTDDAEALKE